MKKIFILVLAALLSTSLLVACTDDKTTTDNKTNTDKVSTENNDKTSEDKSSYDTRFDNTVEDAVACYFSLMTEEGFGNYFLAFPEEFREGHQALLEYTDEEMDAAIKYDTEKVHINRDEKYGGAEFHIEYTLVETTNVPDDRKARIISDLEDYCYMTAGTIEDIVEYKYSVITYGVDTVTGDRVLEEEQFVTLAMLYIKESGWYVSPTNFEFP
ncbi:MAG: hypothetical protein E7613_03265 [Ruminococcaceae bacterium]|nr:hypothetical protein [Oscillospiraceae bacterium]